MQALGGAALTMRAPEQTWNGLVQVGAGAPGAGTGGEVRLAGAISAGVAPIFNLAPGRDFTLEAPAPGSGITASSYTSTAGLRVDTRGAGAITLNAPVEAAGVTLVSQGSVTLAPGATLHATGGAALTMRAPVQTWNGVVQSGTLADPTGGHVTIAGGITANVAPVFNLAPGRHFMLEATAPGPGGTSIPSSYTSTAGLRVDTRGTGEIALNAPVEAAWATLVSQRRITLASGATLDAGSGSLTMRAPDQTWNGLVRAGTAAAGTGGEVTIAGRITAAVAPVFNLALDRHFTLEASAAGPPGVAPTASSYTSTTVPLRVDTRGAGAITLNAPVTAVGVTLVSQRRITLALGATVRATGAGNALVIAAGQGFDNKAGPGALMVTPAGRWLVFLDTFAGMHGTEPTTAAFDLYHRPFDYADTQRFNIPGQISTLVGVLPGNRIVYGEQPVITVTGQTLAKTYGTAVAPGVTVSGLRPKDPLAAILVGGTTATSPGAAADAPVGNYATTPVPTSLTSRGATQRYLLMPLVDGTLSVNPAPLTVTADNKTRVYGQPNPVLTATLGGILFPAADEAAVRALLGLSTTAVPASPVGPHPITSALSVGSPVQNYTVTAVTPGTLTVNPAPLTVTANDAARLYGAANPAFTARFDGFVLGQDPSVLGGALAFATPATAASPAGHYDIVPSGLTSGNYAITFVPGTLTVLAPVTLPPLALRLPLTVNGVPALHPGDVGFRIAAPVFEPAMPAADQFRGDNELDNERERE